MGDTIVVTRPNNGHRRRSNTGCWTCGLRRKKCDERRDNCCNFAVLSLACAGYGPRPSWMDGGEREKEKAQEIKSKVNRRRRARTSRPNSVGSPVAHNGMAAFEPQSTLNASAITSASEAVDHMTPVTLQSSSTDHSVHEDDILDDGSLPSIAAFNNDSLPPCQDMLITPTSASYTTHDILATGALFFENIADPMPNLVDTPIQFAQENPPVESWNQAVLECNSTFDASCVEWLPLEPFDPKSTSSEIEYYCSHVLPDVFPYMHHDLLAELRGRVCYTAVQDSVVLCLVQLRLLQV